MFKLSRVPDKVYQVKRKQCLKVFTDKHCKSYRNIQFCLTSPSEHTPADSFSYPVWTSFGKATEFHSIKYNMLWYAVRLRTLKGKSTGTISLLTWHNSVVLFSKDSYHNFPNRLFTAGFITLCSMSGKKLKPLNFKNIG